MRTIAISIFTLFISMSALGQKVEVDEQGFETFEMKEGDTTYTMKKYFIVFLKSGANRSHGAEEAEKIQADHLAHINWMAEQGYVDMAGPFGDNGDVRGIFIFNVPTMEKAKELTAMDPAVKAGRLIMEIHPWWAAKGSKLR